MVGLRTQENDKFLRFWKIVQDKAESMGKCFFLDCGEGHIFENDIIECENLTGWLIENDRKNEFDAVFSSNGYIGDEWADDLVAVEWTQTPTGITVEFIAL